MKSLTLIVVVLVALSRFAHGAESESDKFKKLIRDTYNFYPSELSKEEQKKKIPLLDAFAKRVLSNKSSHLPLLRKELQNHENNEFFLFDGASLLFRMSKDKTDLQICANAIAHTRLTDIQGTAYFYFTVDLGRNGIDTYQAIESILNCPKFTVFIVQHFLTLKQNLVVMYCCLQLDEELYVDKFIARLQKERDKETAKTIILVLANCVTKKTKKALLEFADSTTDKELKDFVLAFKYNSKEDLPNRRLTSKREDVDDLLVAFKERKYATDKSLSDRIHGELPYLVNRSDYTNIKQLRRDVAYRISDEAIDEIAFLTYLLKLSFASKD